MTNISDFGELLVQGARDVEPSTFRLLGIYFSYDTEACGVLSEYILYLYCLSLLYILYRLSLYLVNIVNYYCSQIR